MSKLVYILLALLVVIVLIGTVIKQRLKRKLDNIDGLRGIAKKKDESNVIGIFGEDE